MKKVFLGGTCNNSVWRDELIPMLNIKYFNPVVKDWTPECQAEEIHQRETCDFVLYTITPLMTGVYSIAEVVDDSNKRPTKTLFCVLEEDAEIGRASDGFNSYTTTRVVTFTPAQSKSLKAVADMVRRNGGVAFTDLKSVADYLNGGSNAC